MRNLKPRAPHRMAVVVLANGSIFSDQLGNLIKPELVRASAKIATFFL